MKRDNKTPLYVGIDTSKTLLDIYIRPLGEFFSVDNTEAGVREAIKRIKPHKPEKIVIEATGRLEMLFACKAYEAGLPIVVANPLQVHKLGAAIGQLAKTDKLDAQTIAYYGEAVKPRCTEIKPRT